MTVTPLGRDQDCSLKNREPDVPAPWFLDPGGWSKTAAVSLYFIFPGICTLSLETFPVTEENLVKLQVKACALSPVNTKLLAEMKMKKDLFPVGREVAGIVLDVGSKVSFFQPDDEVVGILPLDSEDPGLCEVTRVHEHYL
ncbi:hypothetical protein STEG23_011770, partial [Scotinomys teguina]